MFQITMIRMQTKKQYSVFNVLLSKTILKDILKYNQKYIAGFQIGSLINLNVSDKFINREM